jgi:hypothetical protein
MDNRQDELKINDGLFQIALAELLQKQLVPIRIVD